MNSNDFTIVVFHANKNTSHLDSRKIYPNLGRDLTISDMGKKILRVYPCRTNEGKYDWSHIPKNVKDANTYITLIFLDKSGFTFYHNNSVGNHNIDWLDNHWMTLDDWLSYTHD